MKKGDIVFYSSKYRLFNNTIVTKRVYKELNIGYRVNPKNPIIQGSTNKIPFFASALLILEFLYSLNSVLTVFFITASYPLIPLMVIPWIKYF